MSYQDMSKDQLINQLEILRERIEELERKDAERRREEIALRNMTFVDELTGLYNRRGLKNLAIQQLKLAERAMRRMALLYLDFDRFKNINESYGKIEGDKALMRIADILTNTFRASDIISRYGGDEFVVFAVEPEKDSDKILVNRIIDAIDEENSRNDKAYDLSLSVGLAMFEPEFPSSLADLLKKAEMLMYENKRTRGFLP